LYFYFYFVFSFWCLARSLWPRHLLGNEGGAFISVSLGRLAQLAKKSNINTNFETVTMDA